MSSVRLVTTGKARHTEALAALLGQLEGPIVLVSLARPHATLMPDLEAKGIDTSRIFTVDATGQSVVQAFGPTAFFIDSPTRLERIAMIAGKSLARAGAGAHLVLDTYPFVVNYNGQGAAVEFCHLLATRCRTSGNPLHIISGDDQMKLHAIVDERVAVTA